MTTQAQALADMAVKDFAGAIQIAVNTGHNKSTGHETREYSFEDGSVLSLRAGRVESPKAQRVVFRDACGDLEVRIL